MGGTQSNHMSGTNLFRSHNGHTIDLIVYHLTKNLLIPFNCSETMSPPFFHIPIISVYFFSFNGSRIVLVMYEEWQASGASRWLLNLYYRSAVLFITIIRLLISKDRKKWKETKQQSNMIIDKAVICHYCLVPFRVFNPVQSAVPFGNLSSIWHSVMCRLPSVYVLSSNSM